jgi:hypothetical protein
MIGKADRFSEIQTGKSEKKNPLARKWLNSLCREVAWNAAKSTEIWKISGLKLPQKVVLKIEIVRGSADTLRSVRGTADSLNFQGHFFRHVQSTYLSYLGWFPWLSCCSSTQQIQSFSCQETFLFAFPSLNFSESVCPPNHFMDFLSLSGVPSGISDYHIQFSIGNIMSRSLML